MSSGEFAFVLLELAMLAAAAAATGQGYRWRVVLFLMIVPLMMFSLTAGHVEPQTQALATIGQRAESGWVA